MESISKFTDYIKSTLKEARSVIHKFQENITRYYNQKYIPTLVFCPSNKIFLDSLDIHTIYSSTKLSHYYLKPYMVEKQVEPISYYLKLPSILYRLYLVFSVIKFTISTSPIPERHTSFSLNLVIINRE